MRRIQITIFLVLSSFSSLLQAQTTKKDQTMEQQLRNLMNQMVSAELTQNTEFFRGFMGDDFVIGTTLGDVLNKTQAIERLGSVEHKIQEYRTDDMEVRVYGTTAVVIDRETVKGTDKGRPFGGEFRFIRVFVRRLGKWQLVVAQGTPLAKP